MIKKAEIPKHIVATALDLAAERGWAGLSMREIAAAAGVPLAVVQEHYPTKGAILEAFTRQVTAAVLADEDGFDAEEAPRDRLFDVLMRRFDALQPHRKALASILLDQPRDPVSALAGLAGLQRSMGWMLETAGLDAGAARSFVWENRVPTILARDFTPRGVVELFTKDLGIVLEAGKSLDFPLPMTAVAQQQFLAAAAMGHQRADDGAVVKVYEQLTGVDVATAAQSQTD